MRLDIIVSVIIGVFGCSLFTYLTGQSSQLLADHIGSASTVALVCIIVILLTPGGRR